MPQPRLNDLLERAEKALNRARSVSDASTALCERTALNHELRDLLRSVATVQAQLENARLANNGNAEQRLIGNALAEVQSVRDTIRALLGETAG